MVLVTFDFPSAPKVHWRARAGAPALEQKPKILCTRTYSDEKANRYVRDFGWGIARFAQL